MTRYTHQLICDLSAKSISILFRCHLDPIVIAFLPGECDSSIAVKERQRIIENYKELEKVSDVHYLELNTYLNDTVAEVCAIVHGSFDPHYIAVRGIIDAEI
eukprot:Pgem_evm1s17287